MWDYSSTSANGYHFNYAFLILILVILAIDIVVYWKIFEKAGEAGWKAIIPIYNVIIAFKVAGINPYWIIAFLVPIVNIFVAGYLYINLGKKFGKDPFWSVILLFILAPIGQLILAFGKSKHSGNSPTPTIPPYNSQQPAS